MLMLELQVLSMSIVEDPKFVLDHQVSLLVSSEDYQANKILLIWDAENKKKKCFTER